MVARQHLRWHVLAPPGFGPGVIRTVEQAVDRRVEAVKLVAALVVEHAGLQAGDRVDQGHGGDFATREHKVTQTDLAVHMRVNETLVHAFVATADQHRTARSRPAFHGAVVQSLANG